MFKFETINQLSSDPNDLQAQTHVHFLIDEQLTSLPDIDVADTPVNRYGS
jgi:hypothetical protein